MSKVKIRNIESFFLDDVLNTINNRIKTREKRKVEKALSKKDNSKKRKDDKNHGTEKDS